MDALCKAFDLSISAAQILNDAWSHPYDCTCKICLTAWAMVGPDGGEPGNYGPFTKEQVNARQRELNEAETE